MRELRKSLPAKIIAILLLLCAAAGTALGFGGMVLLSEGYATADRYGADKLCLEPMENGMYCALWYFTEDDSFNVYNTSLLNSRYQGLAVQVFDGRPEDGNLVGVWGEVPKNPKVTHTMTEEYHLNTAADPSQDSAPGANEEISEADEAATGTDTAPQETPTRAGYYTMVGYLPMLLPYGSLFHLTENAYCSLHPLTGSITILTFLLLAAAVLLLVFLLSAAGHRRGQEGIVPNWQDRIPLDLYLAVAGTVFVLALAFGVSCVDDYYGRSLTSLNLTLFALCVLVCALLVLAFLMTLATRLKLGKWWRGTLCWKLLRWCGKLWKRCWGAVRNFAGILPMTWKVVLGIAAVLASQTFLTLLMFESYNGGFFFLVALVFDAALVVGAAWITRQLQQIKETGKALAAGDLEAKIDASKMRFDLREHAEDLNAIGQGMTRAVEQRMKSERLKTELITNVSHDIKTPLTSIANYVDLLKKEELPETAAEYLAVLDRQSRRLKKLTEDLVEASKASTGNVSVKLEPIVVNEIIHQAVGDYDEKLTAGRLEVIVSTYEGNVMVLADGRLLWRVLDNLLSNVCKYALAGTRVYVDLTSEDGRVTLAMKNISRDPLNIRPDELMERFVRGDASRHTEGSGLGLNIARSLMDLMGGTFDLSVDGDLFKATLTLREAQ